MVACYVYLPYRPFQWLKSNEYIQNQAKHSKFRPFLELLAEKTAYSGLRSVEKTQCHRPTELEASLKSKIEIGLQQQNINIEMPVFNDFVAMKKELQVDIYSAEDPLFLALTKRFVLNYDFKNRVLFSSPCIRGIEGVRLSIIVIF